MKAIDFSARLMPETQLRYSVQELLTIYGWTWHHETDSRKSRKGFPDLIAVHPSGRFLLIELKGYDARIDGDKITSVTWEPIDWQSGVIERALRVPRRAVS